MKPSQWHLEKIEAAVAVDTEVVEEDTVVEIEAVEVVDAMTVEVGGATTGEGVEMTEEAEIGNFLNSKRKIIPVFHRDDFLLREIERYHFLFFGPTFYLGLSFECFRLCVHSFKIYYFCWFM